jgi:hypothetical protein
MRLLAVALAACLLGACGADDSKEGSGGEVAAAVSEQLRYLDPQSEAVIAIDLRWKGENWKAFRPILDRVFAKWRETAPDEQIPGSTTAVLEQVVRYSNLNFSRDVEPALDGHLLIGVRAGVAVLVYHTEAGDLRRLAEGADESIELRSLKGFDDTMVTSDSSLALVGTKTAVLVEGAGEPSTALRAALTRAEQGAGFPADRLAEAERDAGFDDPLLLATGDLSAGRYLFDLEEPDLERARESVPYLSALRRGSMGVEADDEGLEGRLRLVTDREELAARDLPVGPAGDLELPEGGAAAVLGANRDQSYTTTFGAQVARALYADSRFVRAVERAEKVLGISFEDEVLRQFDCPSVSILEPPGERTPGRFAARSCVNDPDRMRELLPRLAPHLPAILNGLDALGSRGLTGLLLLAPDAPLVPGVALGQIDVQPLGGGDDEELYEITAPPRIGPDRMVFGLIGDSFVVATDEEMARHAADLETESLDEDAAGAVRVPVAELLQLEGDDVRPFAEVFEPLEATISADPGATIATARLDLRD